MENPGQRGFAGAAQLEDGSSREERQHVVCKNQLELVPFERRGHASTFSHLSGGASALRHTSLLVLDPSRAYGEGNVVDEALSYNVNCYSRWLPSLVSAEHELPNFRNSGSSMLALSPDHSAEYVASIQHASRCVHGRPCHLKRQKRQSETEWGMRMP